MELFSAQMKVADLVDLNFHLLGILTRFGIKPGFGEATVAEACRQRGVDIDTFLLICNVYTFDDYIPSADTLSAVKAEDIVRYLHLSHVYYVDSALVTLATAIDKMLAPSEGSRKTVIRRFFTDYKEELERHFQYEEGHVFPYVEMLTQKKAHTDRQATGFGDGHSNIEEKIGDLKNIVMKYLPDDCDSAQAQQVLLFIHYLEKDLARHTSIEDTILSPMIERLENDAD